MGGTHLYVNALELLRIGPGPSSARTLGPQRAALRFVHALAADGHASRVFRVEVHLFGALALAAREAGTEAAVVAGLAGDLPEHSDARSLLRRRHDVSGEGLALGGGARIAFDPRRDVRLHMGKAMAFGSNAVRFDAFDAAGGTLASALYVTRDSGDVLHEDEPHPALPSGRVPYRLGTGEEILAACRTHGKKVPDLVRANECVFRSPDELRAGLARIGLAMRGAVERGLATREALPGGRLRQALHTAQALGPDAPAATRCAVYAAAVAEESASGGCVVSAPTHGAAGPVAALLEHWRRDAAVHDDRRAGDFLLTAALIGRMAQAAGLRQAGCQGAVGLASGMAAAGYVAALGGSAQQVLYAAERALDAHWGLACDEMHARMQDPCIERNAAGATHALDAAHRALREPAPRLAFDSLVRGMVETGRGMAGRHKDDALAGLARNVADC